MALLLACATVDGIWAQENSPWIGEPLPSEGGEFYLYNKVGNGFLLGANSWGTQASLGQPGLLCTLEAMPDGKYAIKTMSDKYLKDDYIDKDKNGYDFTDLNPEDDVYEFSLFGNGRYLYYAGSGTVLSRTEEPDNYQWILVSKEQRIRALEKATEEEGIDATFYITGANFDRSQPSDWQESHNGGTLTLIGPERAAKSTNSCTEAYDNENFDVYQVLTGVKNGLYLVSCQGYYRPGGNVDAAGARNAVLYANADEAPLQLLADDGNGIPNNMDQAADAFLFASKTETQGIVLLEAFAGKTPVIALRASGVEDIVTDGKTGLLTEENPDSFARAIGRFLSDTTFRNELSRNAFLESLSFREEMVAAEALRRYNESIVKEKCEGGHGKSVSYSCG